MTVPSIVNTKRKTSVFLKRSSLYLWGDKYNTMVATAYNSTEKILFDVQWWPEKFFSQSFSGADNSAQIVITTIKIIVRIAAYADEMINFDLFIKIYQLIAPQRAAAEITNPIAPMRSPSTATAPVSHKAIGRSVSRFISSFSSKVINNTVIASGMMNRKICSLVSMIILCTHGATPLLIIGFTSVP